MFIDLRFSLLTSRSLSLCVLFFCCRLFEVTLEGETIGCLTPLPLLHTKYPRAAFVLARPLTPARHASIYVDSKWQIVFAF